MPEKQWQVGTRYIMERTTRGALDEVNVGSDSFSGSLKATFGAHLGDPSERTRTALLSRRNSSVSLTGDRPSLPATRRTTISIGLAMLASSVERKHWLLGHCHTLAALAIVPMMLDWECSVPTTWTQRCRFGRRSRCCRSGVIPLQRKFLCGVR